MLKRLQLTSDGLPSKLYLPSCRTQLYNFRDEVLSANMDKHQTVLSPQRRASLPTEIFGIANSIFQS